MNYTDYSANLDYTRLPGYEKLDLEQRQKLQEVYYWAYHAALPAGLKTALGKAYEDARKALEEALKPVPKAVEPAPTSIFEGLENCQ